MHPTLSFSLFLKDRLQYLSDLPITKKLQFSKEERKIKGEEEYIEEVDGSRGWRLDSE